MLEKIISQAQALQASDLHLSVGSKPTARVQGVLQPLDYDELSEQMLEQFLRALLPQKVWHILQRQGEADCAAICLGQRCRVNAYRQHTGLAAAIRLLPKQIPDCEELRIPESIIRLVQEKSGLLLIAGATGSGKSTTLASLTNYINHRKAAHIITLEDPIEYQYKQRLSLIHQREVGRDTRTFASGLRSALREDPDVLVVGELRDSESMAIALNAAETGHLVLATLHTSDAISSVNRIIDVLPQPQTKAQLAACLLGIMGQRLLPRAGGRGVIGAFEVLVATEALRNLIREGRTHQLLSYLETGGRFGMISMSEAIKALQRQGLIP